MLIRKEFQLETSWGCVACLLELGLPAADRRGKSARRTPLPYFLPTPFRRGHDTGSFLSDSGSSRSCNLS